MKPVSAVVFDLDGTLYLHKPLQRKMIARLLWRALSRPSEGIRCLGILSAYRRAQEILRQQENPAGEIATLQLEIAARRCGVETSEVLRVVEHWMGEVPLPLLRSIVRPGILEMLNWMKSSEILLGLLSDYPAEAKLGAMGIRHWFDAVASAQEKEINRFKPNPRGLEVVLDRLGVAADQALYVGDREDVDGNAARRAGVDVVILQKPDCSALETRLARRGVAKRWNQSQNLGLFEGRERKKEPKSTGSTFG